MRRRTRRSIAWFVAATLLTACATPPRAPTSAPAAVHVHASSGGATDHEPPGPSRGLPVRAQPTAPTQAGTSERHDSTPYAIAGIMVGVGLLVIGGLAITLSDGWRFDFRP